MTAIRIHSILLASVAAVMLVTGGTMVTPAQAQVSSDDQKCINGMNKAGAKLAATVGKNNAGCIKNATKGKETDADACVAGDLKSKIGKAEAKVTATQGKSCAVAPSFGFTDSATIIAIAEEQQRALAHDVFGTTIQSIIDTGDDGKCQAAVSKVVEKFASAIFKDFLSCKKAGLKDGTITDASGLAACVMNDEKSKVAKAETKVGDTVDKKCGATNLDDNFGDCPAGSFAPCLVTAAIGRTCQAINGVDGISAPCDFLDDGLLNGTSPGCGNGVVEASVGETCDDGNTTDDGNGCDATCQRNDVCGNGTIEALFEDCDDTVETATCDSDCTNVVCGDGVHNPTAGEACDDGSSNGGGEGFCLSDCSASQLCGDTVVNGSEHCDDGNTIDDLDGCGADCLFTQAAECPSRGRLRFYAGSSTIACTSNTDCTNADPEYPGSCNVPLGKCVTSSILDTGWTGVSHTADVLDNGFISGDLLCPGGATYGGANGSQACGECLVTGVNPDENNCRCSQNTYQICDQPFEQDGDDCGEPVTCTDTGRFCEVSGNPCTQDSQCTANAGAEKCLDECRYCNNNPTIKCRSDSQCGGGKCIGGDGFLSCNASAGMCQGTCDCYLGSPLPISAGNVPVCVVNKLAKNVSGTANVDTGDAEFDLGLRSIVHLANSKLVPCPVCGGTCTAGKVGSPCFVNLDCDSTPFQGNGVCANYDPTSSDGVRGGTCTKGDFVGMACDIDGFSTTFPALPGVNGGGLSLDCMPAIGTNVSGTGLKIALNPTTGTANMGANVDCGGIYAGYDCHCRLCTGDLQTACNSDAECAAAGLGTCSTATGGEPTQPNDCNPTGTGGDGTVGSCLPVAGTAGQFGECADPTDDIFTCDGIVRGNGEGFISCGPASRQCSDKTQGSLGGQTSCTADSHCGRCSGNNARCEVGGPVTCPIPQTCNAAQTCEYTDCLNAGVPEGYNNTDVGKCTLGKQRPCFLDTITTTGTPHPSKGIGVAQFCIPATINPGINGVAGLPGPGRTRLQVTSKTFCPSSTQYVPGAPPSACP